MSWNYAFTFITWHCCLWATPIFASSGWLFKKIPLVIRSKAVKGYEQKQLSIASGGGGHKVRGSAEIPLFFFFWTQIICSPWQQQRRVAQGQLTDLALQCQHSGQPVIAWAESKCHRGSTTEPALCLPTLISHYSHSVKTLATVNGILLSTGAAHSKQMKTYPTVMVMTTWHRESISQWSIYTKGPLFGKIHFTGVF